MPHIKILAKPKSGPSNPRNYLVYTSIERAHPEIKIDEFSKVRLLFGKYDIFHFHWPDRIFKSRDILAVVKVLALLAVLMWVRVRGTTVVWTVHNPVVKNRQPRRMLQRLYYRVIRTCVDVFVFPSRASRREFTEIWPRLGLRSPSLERSEAIPLGLQMELLDKGYQFPEELPDTLNDYYLIVGRIDAEKNIEATVIDLDQALRDDPARIVIAGMPKGTAMVAMLRELQSLPRVTVLPRFLIDEEVNALIKRARAVVIDYPVTNSGVATLAAAMDANILFSNWQMVDDFVSDYAYARCHALRREDGWIVENLPHTVAAPPASPIDSKMTMAVIGEQYAQLFLGICQKV